MTTLSPLPISLGATDAPAMERRRRPAAIDHVTSGPQPAEPVR